MNKNHISVRVSIYIFLMVIFFVPIKLALMHSKMVLSPENFQIFSIISFILAMFIFQTFFLPVKEMVFGYFGILQKQEDIDYAEKEFKENMISSLSFLVKTISFIAAFGISFTFFVKLSDFNSILISLLSAIILVGVYKSVNNFVEWIVKVSK